MKSVVIAKKKIKSRKQPFGTGKFSRIIDVKYLNWYDSFEIIFDNHFSYLIEHDEFKKANNIKAGSQISCIRLDEELGSGFYVEYDNGQIGEASWEFIIESP